MTNTNLFFEINQLLSVNQAQNNNYFYRVSQEEKKRTQQSLGKSTERLVSDIPRPITESNGTKIAASLLFIGSEHTVSEVVMSTIILP